MTSSELEMRWNQIEKINEEVVTLFKCHSRDEGLMPMVYDSLAIRPIVLFMGYNPSLPKYESKFDLGNWPANASELKKGQRSAKATSYKKYFNHFHEVGTRLGLKLWEPERDDGFETANYWDHIDLFFSRTQKGADKIAFFSKGQVTIFGKKQIMLTRSLIDIIDPVNIVVANSEASRIILGEWEKNINYDCKVGFGTINLDKSKSRIFFTRQWANRGLGPYTQNIIAAYLKEHLAQASF